METHSATNIKPPLCVLDKFEEDKKRAKEKSDRYSRSDSCIMFQSLCKQIQQNVLSSLPLAVKIFSTSF